MKPVDGQTTSIWYENVVIPSESGPPVGPIAADVCVVGAGISGLLSAYLLSKEGKSVLVIDEGEVGSGQTGRTSAHLASIIDDRFMEIERLRGLDGSKMAYNSHAAAIDLIEKISADESIDCEFKRLDAYLFLAPGDKPSLLPDELAASKRAGVVAAELIEKPALKNWTDAPAMRYGNQARFHPLKFLVGLAAACEKRGVRIYTGCRCTGVTGADPKKGIRARVTLGDGTTTIDAGAIVVATNAPAPINDWVSIYLKQSAYRTYMVGLKMPAGSVDDVLYWDTADPYHYVRLDGDVLISGGNDHKVGQYPKTGDPFVELEKWTREKFPAAGALVSKWSGQVNEPADYLGFIGKAPTSGEDVYVITGDSGMGLTHAGLGAILVTDLIQNRHNLWTALYDPTRTPIDKDFVTENANTMSQYVDLITGGDVKSADDIAPGEGAVIRHGLHKVAVYKDPAGKVSECSAVCTHLACIVHWNPAEKSWDCPCHGSRFSPEGKVLMGPAISDLAKVEK